MDEFVFNAAKFLVSSVMLVVTALLVAVAIKILDYVVHALLATYLAVKTVLATVADRQGGQRVPHFRRKAGHDNDTSLTDGMYEELEDGKE